MALGSKPAFTVIEGGGSKTATWLSPPSTVIGRSPFDPERIMSFRVTVLDVEKHLAAGRRQPLFDLWWHVCGVVPPVPGADRYQEVADQARNSLGNAHACFRGIKRPCGEDDRGFDYAAFITKPSHGFRYRPSMGCVIEPYEIPSDLVLVTYVKLDFPEGRTHHRRNAPPPVTNGVVTLWQLVECAPDDPLLPVEYEERFRRRLW